MRIYNNLAEAVRETERDLFEMGITAFPKSMQDKTALDPGQFQTLELIGYGIQLNRISTARDWIFPAIRHLAVSDEDAEKIYAYAMQEFVDRTSSTAANPGNSYLHRREVWNQFILPGGQFHYTYSERVVPQLAMVIERMKNDPDTRQAVVTIFNGIEKVWSADSDTKQPSYWEFADDQRLAGGKGRIPCSMYYQFMRRGNNIHMVYTMRSCDFLTHFIVDVVIALMIQTYVANQLSCSPGVLTYMAGSLHAYKKDLDVRKIF